MLSTTTYRDVGINGGNGTAIGITITDTIASILGSTTGIGWWEGLGADPRTDTG